MTAFARATQALALVEIAATPEVRATQALALIEIAPVRFRITQALALVEIAPIIPVLSGAADSPGSAGGASANAGGGAASTTPSATTPQSTTGTGANAGGSAASTSPTVSTPRSASTGRSANAGGSTPSTSAKATAPRAAMASAGGVQVTEAGGMGGAPAGSAAPLPGATAGAMDRTGKFSAELYDRTGARVLPPDLTLIPLQYSAKAVGGPDQAALAVEGVFPALWSALGWLAYSVRIVSPLGRVVWEGIVEEVAVTLPALRVGLSIRDLYNRVQVQYTRTLDAEAATESLETAWAANAASIARYGTKELRLSLNDGSLAQAEALRATALDAAYKPLQTVVTGGGGAPGAELRCIGRWLTLDWQYYGNDAGYITYEAEQTTEQAIGYSYTGTGIGFRGDAIHDINMGLSTMPEGSTVVVTGSPANSGTMAIDSAPETVIADQVTVTSTDINFDPADDILSGTVDWSPFEANEMIQVSGSTSNNGFWWIKKVDALSPGPGDPRIEVSGGGIVSEADGDTVTVTQGHNATITDAAFTTETPGAAVTIASYTKIAQRVLATASWDAQDIVLLLARTGAPVDGLKVSLYSEAAGIPDASLSSVTLAAVDVGTGLEWIECSLAAPVAITATNHYWIVIERDGAADDENYWIVGVSDERVSTFTAKVWTGAAWIDHPAAVDVPVQVWATVDSAVKAGAIGAAADAVNVVDVTATTGVRVRSFSDGSKRISEEMQALLDAGNSTAARLLAWFDAAGALVVGVKQADDGTLAIQQDGALTLLPQQQWEAGALPVRRWARIMDLPPGEIFEDMSPFYIEAATYDPATMALAIEPEANQNVWEMGV